MPPKLGQKVLTHEQRMELMKKVVQLHEEGFTQREISLKVGVSQPTVCIWLNKVRRGYMERRQDRIAAKIRAELVCCDIYQRLEALQVAGDGDGRHALRHSHEYHDICFYGEWAARIAEDVK